MQNILLLLKKFTLFYLLFSHVKKNSLSVFNFLCSSLCLFSCCIGWSLCKINCVLGILMCVCISSGVCRHTDCPKVGSYRFSSTHSHKVVLTAKKNTHTQKTLLWNYVKGVSLSHTHNQTTRKFLKGKHISFPLFFHEQAVVVALML